jgi:hypothetical protein
VVSKLISTIFPQQTISFLNQQSLIFIRLMATVTVKGHQILVKVTKTGTDRKSVQFANHIVDELKKLNIPRDDIRIKTNVLGSQNIPATIEFWAQGHYMRFSYALTKRFVDNLYVIRELIRIEVAEVLAGTKEITEFYHTFSETGDRKELSKNLTKAKVTLGLSETEDDVKTINDAYKKLARAHHPDLGGNLEEFQKINKAHKLIKKEMGF